MVVVVVVAVVVVVVEAAARGGEEERAEEGQEDEKEELEVGLEEGRVGARKERGIAGVWRACGGGRGSLHMTV